MNDLPAQLPKGKPSELEQARRREENRMKAIARRESIRLAMAAFAAAHATGAEVTDEELDAVLQASRPAKEPRTREPEDEGINRGRQILRLLVEVLADLDSREINRSEDRAVAAFLALAATTLAFPDLQTCQRVVAEHQIQQSVARDGGTPNRVRLSHAHGLSHADISRIGRRGGGRHGRTSNEYSAEMRNSYDRCNG